MADVIDITQLDSVRYKFTELGTAVRELSRQNEVFFKGTADELRFGFTQALSELTENPEFEETAKLLGISKHYAEQVSMNYDAISGKMEKSFDKLDDTVGKAEKSFESLSKEATTLVREGEDITATVGKGKKERGADRAGDRKRGKVPGLTDRFSKVIVSELNTLKSRIQGMLSTLKVPTPGNIVGGLIQILAYGYLEKDRIRAETGEVKNILIAAYDDGVKGAVQSGTRHIAGIQETFQRFMGINRKEVQAVSQSFVDGGLSVTQMLAKVDTKLNNVQASALTVTFALDKMFEIPAGDSAKKMVGLMADYGKNAEDARESVVRMYMVGKQSGIGALQFVQNIETAGQELRQFGYDIDDAIDLLAHVQEDFADIGVPKQFAGRQAALGIQQIASGITKMSDSWKILVAERLGYGRGLEGRQKMMDAFARVLEQKNTNEIVRVVQAVYDIAREATGGENEAQVAFYIEKQMGFGFEGARVVSKIGKDIKEGKVVEAAKSAKNDMEILRKSFGIEAKKQSKFERFMNMWLKGLSKVGQGLLGLIGNTLAMLIAYFRALPAYLANAVLGRSDENAKLVENLHAFDVQAAAHSEKMGRGFDQMIKAMGKMGGDVLGSSLKSLKAAWEFDPTASLTPAAGGGRGGTAWQPTQATTRFVSIPLATLQKGGVGARHVINVSVPVKQQKEGAGGGKGGEWVGGGVSVVAKGVDAQGNIDVSIIGNCPRCGFIFGSSTPTSATEILGEGEYRGIDVEALARVIQREIGGYTGRNRKLAAATAHTILNQAKSRGTKDLYQIATGGLGWGRQGGKRRFGTTSVPTRKTIDFARSVLRGEVEDPTGGRAKTFTHQRLGTEIQGGAFAPFARESQIVMALPVGKGKTAFFFTGGKDIAREAPQYRQMRRQYEDALAARKAAGVQPVSGSQKGVRYYGAPATTFQPAATEKSLYKPSAQSPTAPPVTQYTEKRQRAPRTAYRKEHEED